MTRSAVLAMVVSSLAACSGSGIRETLGYGKEAPDEFSVLTKAPLVVPPDFSLRPPRPGAGRPQEAEASANARRAVFGRADGAVSTSDTAVPSEGEQKLLSNAGVTQAASDIRQVLDEETRALKVKEEGFVDNLIFWDSGSAPEEAQVDASGEMRRLQQNEALGNVPDDETADTEEASGQEQ